jgi:hypothetical protein
MGSSHINEELAIQRLLEVNARWQAQWDGDVAALRALFIEEESLPLRMGDLLNTLKTRWSGKMPDLAKEAGLSPHTARQRARIAAQIPPESKLRHMGLPFSILRLLAPLDDPEPWGERACEQRDAGELHVRSFARELEEAGRPRPRRPAHCLRCGCEIAVDADRITVRAGGRNGHLCGRDCAAAYFTAPVASPSQAAASPKPTLSRPAMHFSVGRDTASHVGTESRFAVETREARLLAASAAGEEAGVGRLLSRRVQDGLGHPPRHAPEPSAR